MLDHMGNQDFQDYRSPLDGQENEDTKVQREILATQANQATQVSRVKEAEGVQLVLQVHLAHRVFLDRKENKDHVELRVTLCLVVLLKERKVTWEREVSRAI